MGIIDCICIQVMVARAATAATAPAKTVATAAVTTVQAKAAPLAACIMPSGAVFEFYEIGACMRFADFLLEMPDAGGQGCQVPRNVPLYHLEEGAEVVDNTVKLLLHSLSPPSSRPKSAAESLPRRSRVVVLR